MAELAEIAQDVYRISTYIPPFDLQFNQFLVLDDEPLLFHTGMNALFADVKDAVARVLDPQRIRWICFSHFEADECGSLRRWQTVAPEAVATCSFVAKVVSVDDTVAARPAKPLADDARFSTGKYRFRFLRTPHVPHCWEAGLLYEETQGTLLCSDLFHQNGNVEAKTSSDVVGRFRQTLLDYQKGPLANYLPYTSQTDGILRRLGDLKPKTLAAMHGSTFCGDGQRAIQDLAAVVKDVLGHPS